MSYAVTTGVIRRAHLEDNLTANLNTKGYVTLTDKKGYTHQLTRLYSSFPGRILGRILHFLGLGVVKLEGREFDKQAVYVNPKELTGVTGRAGRFGAKFLSLAHIQASLGRSNFNEGEPPPEAKWVKDW